jgi:hypothetical protein
MRWTLVFDTSDDEKSPELDLWRREAPHLLQGGRGPHLPLASAVDAGSAR